MAVKKTTVKKTKDGTVDKRTKEGKAIVERMAQARAEKNSLKNRIKRDYEKRKDLSKQVYQYIDVV